VHAQLVSAVALATVLTHTDATSSTTPYALVALAIVAALGCWTAIGAAAYVALRKRLTRFYASVAKHDGLDADAALPYDDDDVRQTAPRTPPPKASHAHRQPAHGHASARVGVVGEVDLDEEEQEL
jgi:hypothetical protein